MIRGIAIIKQVFLGTILILSFLFRFWDLTRIGLRGDEAVYSGQALILAGREEMTRFFFLASRGTSNFLLHQGIQALIYRMAGFSELTTRILPLIFSVSTVLIVYLLGRELFGYKTGLIAAFFLAINGYAVTLGRLALLDSTMAFFFTLALFFLVKWLITKKSTWFYLFTIGTAIAVMTKVPAVLVLPIAFLTLFITDKFKAVDRRILVRSSLLFIISTIPATIQVVFKPDLYIDFFSEGTARISSVPVTYYLDKLVGAAGLYFIIITFLGIVVAGILRSKGDILCLIWLSVVAVYFQLYPLKGFNYILPLIPAASLLAARALTSMVGKLKMSASWNPRMKISLNKQTLIAISGILLLTVSSFSLGYTSLYNVTYDRPFVGLREAAYWLKDNAPPGSAAMTISQGSAQYVLSLYGGIDSYPFGDFRLHTILPGGAMIAGAPPPDPLIQNGTVNYLVHYVSWGGDDPIHVPVKTPSEQRFIDFILKYQCHLRHIVYYEFVGLKGEKIREPRVWIYEVGKRLPEPQLQVVRSEDTTLQLKGEGFLINSFVTLYYDRFSLGKYPTDDRGSFDVSVRLPTTPIYGMQLVVIDEGGNRVTLDFDNPVND